MNVILESNNVVKKEKWKNIFDRIFVVCKNDPHFKMNDKVKQLESEIAILEGKVNKNSNVVSKAEDFKKDMQRKIELLDDQNVELKSSILEKLGSEL
jgi:hypothetical protein